MRKVVICIMLVLLLAFGASPVYANGVPQFPHAFYGSVDINGSPAPDGTEVSATVDDGEVITNVQNPTKTAGGSYGIGDSPYLLVQGNITPGATITFHVTNADGTAIADVTATFEVGGGPDLKDLSVTIEPEPEPEPEPGPGPGPSAPTYYTDTNLFGTETRFRISRTGEILKTIEATSADGNLTITIPKGTVALDKDGKRLASLETAVDESPPDPPEDAHVIGLAYDFGPDGATFDPAITLEYTYDPDALPEGVDEEDLILAYYDEATGEWVELDCVVDTVNNTITASVSHFTTFAIIGSVTPPAPTAPARFTVSSLGVSPSEVAPGEEVNISVLVANTGGKSGSYQVTLVINDLVEATKEVTVRAGLSKEVTFSVTREEADTYTVAVDGLSGSFTVIPVVIPPEPAAFSVSYLSIQPAEVEPNEAVTITVFVANTGGESGSYPLVLKIDGVKAVEETVTVAAGESQGVSFSVTREEAGSYTVTVDGLSGSFTVVAPEEEEEVPIEPPGVNWPLIGGIIGGVIVVGLLIYFLVFRRRTPSFPGV